METGRPTDSSRGIVKRAQDRGARERRHRRAHRSTPTPDGPLDSRRADVRLDVVEASGIRRASEPGTGDEECPAHGREAVTLGKPLCALVDPEGEEMRRVVADRGAQGARPVLLSLIPRARVKLAIGRQCLRIRL